MSQRPLAAVGGIDRGGRSEADSTETREEVTTVAQGDGGGWTRVIAVKQGLLAWVRGVSLKPGHNYMYFLNSSLLL